MSEGWPDFWIKGKYIELIDTINTVNLIKKIEQIDNITSLGTLDTINTVGTIQKINPQTINSTEYNTVLDLIKKIQQIDNISNLGTLDIINTVGTIQKINPTATENVVIDRIAKIDNVTNLGTLDTLNTIGTIQKINPQNTDNVVIDRVKTINTIETVNNLGTLNTINTIDTLNTLSTVNTVETINTIQTVNTINNIDNIERAGVPSNPIFNSEFRLGLEGWNSAGAEATTLNDYTCAKFGTSTFALVFQRIVPEYGMPAIVCWLASSVDNGQITVIVDRHGEDALSQTITLTTANQWEEHQIIFEKPGIITRVTFKNATDGAYGYVTKVRMNILRPRWVSTIKSFNISASSSGNYGVWTPSSGKAIRLKLIQYESDADVEVGLRFGDTGSLFARRTTKGVMALNLIGCNIQGGTDEALNLYTGGAVNVKGFVLGEEV